MGKQWKQWQTFFFFWGGASKITADGYCSHGIKRSLLLGRKAMTYLDSILKSRDINLPTKVHLVKAMIFPVVMYGCEISIIRKAEHWRIDAFELSCWTVGVLVLRVPWTARRTNQSILIKVDLDIHWKDWCWSWSSNSLATCGKNWLIGKDLDAGKDWRQKEKVGIVGWHHQLHGCDFEQALGVVNG